MTTRQRGQPLIFLAMIVVLWIGVRIFAWTRPALERTPVASAEAAPPAQRLGWQLTDVPANPALVAAGSQRPFMGAARYPVRRRSVLPIIAVNPLVKAMAGDLIEGDAKGLPVTVAEMQGSRASPAFAQLAQPPAAVTVPTSSELPYAPGRRWSGDGWVLVRGGSGPGGAGPGVASYGGNQIGGVLRYRLVPGGAHRPTAYFRLSAALNGSGERDAALGLSIRPVAAIPAIAAVEARVGMLSGRTVVRPVVMAVTELPPAALPGELRAELYTQAGYVGGGGATPFADGQVRLDRRIFEAGGAVLRAGAGAWGGAQRGAARLDVGPTAALQIAKGSAAARVGLDWRFRLAGLAEPGSGPALTVSAGF